MRGAASCATCGEDCCLSRVPGAASVAQGAPRPPSSFLPWWGVGTLLGALRISGIVKSGELAALPPPPSCGVGWTLAYSDAYLLAFSGGCPVSFQGVFAFLPLPPSFWVGMLNVLPSIKLGNRVARSGVLLHRACRGVRVPFSLPPVRPPGPCWFAFPPLKTCDGAS